jgi:hypothetical protein
MAFFRDENGRERAEKPINNFRFRFFITENGSGSGIAGYGSGIAGYESGNGI